MAIVVRKLDVSDWELVRDVRLRALLDTPGAFYKTYAEESAYGEERWRSWFAAGRAIFAAELDGAPVGLIAGIPAGEDERDDEVVMMVSMWVEPARRGDGVAKELTDALVGWARGYGYPRMVLWVYDGNPRAAAFYRRYGFTGTGRTETFDNDPRKISLMTMDL